MHVPSCDSQVPVTQKPQSHAASSAQERRTQPVVSALGAAGSQSWFAGQAKSRKRQLLFSQRPVALSQISPP